MFGGLEWDKKAGADGQSLVLAKKETTGRR